MSVTFSDFGVTAAGERAVLARVDNGCLRAAFTSYGAALTALEVPCGDGRLDVALGYDSLDGYVRGGGYLGATPTA